MIRSSSRALLLALLLGFAAPAPAADPMLMFLLSVAREVILAASRAQAAAPAETFAPVATYPGTTVEPAHVKRLVDEGFNYLSESQREEVFDSLHGALMNPKNAALRGPMIEYFAHKAVEVRTAQERLAILSQPEKARLAADFRKQVAGLPDEEAAQLAELLRRQVLPVPSDLNEMLLAALEAR